MKRALEYLSNVFFCDDKILRGPLTVNALIVSLTNELWIWRIITTPVRHVAIHFHQNILETSVGTKVKVKVQVLSLDPKLVLTTSQSVASQKVGFKSKGFFKL